MGRLFALVYLSFWNSPTVAALSEDARAAALYLLTCPHGNFAGVFRLPDAYACDDLGWTLERWRAAAHALVRADFIARTESGWTWIRQYAKWNPLNPNVRKHVMQLLALMPEDLPFKACAYESWTEKEPFPKGSERVSESTSTSPSKSLSSKSFKSPTRTNGYGVIVDSYHALLPDCARWTVRTDKRDRVLAHADKLAREAMGDRYDPERFWPAYFQRCALDDWLAGRQPNPANPRWRQKLETLLDDTRFAQVFEMQEVCRE